jgi:hypothetical protein
MKSRTKINNKMGVKLIFLAIIAVGLYYLFTRPTIEGMMMEEKKKETAVMNMEGMMPKMEAMMPKMEDMLQKMEGMMEPKKEGYGKK